MLSDPFIVRGLVIMTVVLVFVGVLCWVAATLNEYVANRPPAFRRELEAAYLKFHRFLMTIRAVAVRGLYE